MNWLMLLQSYDPDMYRDLWFGLPHMAWIAFFIFACVLAPLLKWANDSVRKWEQEDKQ